MKKLILVGAVAALALVPASASAHSSSSYQKACHNDGYGSMQIEFDRVLNRVPVEDGLHMLIAIGTPELTRGTQRDREPKPTLHGSSIGGPRRQINLDSRRDRGYERIQEAYRVSRNDSSDGSREAGDTPAQPPLL